MPTLSCITTCKSRLHQLKQTLPLMMRLADTEVIVVDYDCPEGTAAWVRDSYPEAKVVRIEGEAGFNAAKARNLGAGAASAPWLLFLDVDTLAQPQLAEQVKAHVSLTTFLLPDPRPGELFGALVVSREHYDQVGGYDEALQGWGSEDEDMTERLEGLGLKVGSFPGSLLDSLHHDDGLRTLHHEIKDPVINNGINHLYRHAKRDLVRLGAKLTLEHRQVLYEAVKQAALSPGERAFEVPIRSYVNKTLGRSIRATVRYVLTDA